MISVFVFYEENYRLRSSYTGHLMLGWMGTESEMITPGHGIACASQLGLTD